MPSDIQTIALCGLPPQAGGWSGMRSKGYKCYNYHCNGRVGDSPLCGEPGDIPLNCEDRIVLGEGDEPELLEEG